MGTARVCCSTARVCISTARVCIGTARVCIGTAGCARHHGFARRGRPPPTPPQGAPVYSPRAVRFRIGGLPCFARGGALLDGSPALAAALEVAVGRDLHQAVAAAQVQERQWVARAQQLERRVLQRMDEGRGQAQPGDAQVQKHAMQQLLLSLQHAAAQQPDEPGPQRALEAMMVLLGDEREAAVQAARGHPHEQPAADGSWEWTSQIYYVAESDTLQVLACRGAAVGRCGVVALPGCAACGSACAGVRPSRQTAAPRLRPVPPPLRSGFPSSSTRRPFSCCCSASCCIL